MKADIKRSFEKLLLQHGKQADAAEEARKRYTEKRAELEAAWTTARMQVVMPALTEVAELLQANGWTCKLPDVEATSLELQIFKGDMRAAGGEQARPSIAFLPSPQTLKISVYASSQTQTQAAGEFNVSALTEQKVQELALDFFRQLVNETAK